MNFFFRIDLDTKDCLKQFSEIASIFNVERIIINKTRKISSKYKTNCFKKVFENNKYKIYEI